MLSIIGIGDKMIIDKIAKTIYNKIPEKDRENAIAGIVAGIVAGIIGAGIIVAGIGAGIVAGIIVAGIVAGIIVAGIIGAGIGAGIIVAGIVAGIVAEIIVAGIVAGIGDFIQSSPSLSLILILLGILFVLSEMLFLCDKKKPEGQSYFTFTIERKVLAWIESAIMLFSLIGLQQSILKSLPIIRDFFGQYRLPLLNMVGWGTAIIIILYIHIKLNSLKYK